MAQGLLLATLVLLSTFVIIYILPSLFSEQSKKRFLPGPKPKPFVGNLLDIPKEFQFLKLLDWSKTFGPLFRFSVFGQETYVVSSLKVANDLLRDKGAIYSGRPTIPAAGLLLTDNRLTLLLPFEPATQPERTAVWRKGRRFAHQIIGRSLIPNYYKTHDLESCKLVLDLISSPSDYEVLFERYAASIIFRLAYGKPIEDGNEDYLRKMVELTETFDKAASPGTYLVDAFPSMLKLPTFMAPFKKYLLSQRRKFDGFYLELQDMVRKEMSGDEDNAPPSFQKSFLENQAAIGIDDLDGAYLLGTMYGAGVGTTYVMLSVLLLKLLHHPEWQKLMHDEVDREVGQRIPAASDLPNLPTIRAAVKEVLRVTAQGLPRKLIRDDVYDGYNLSAGTMVFPNIWAINRDPELYPDPETFNPARWLSPEYPTYQEPLTIYPNLQQDTAFGFGRRMCPGAHLAERTLNMAAARILWACEVSKKPGVEVPLFDYYSTLLARPKPFQFDLKVRSHVHERLLDEHLEKAKLADPLKDRTSYELVDEEE